MDQKHGVMTETVTDNLQKLIIWWLHKIERLNWYNKINNGKFIRGTKQSPVNQGIKQRCVSWIAHTLGKPVNRVIRNFFQWNTQGKRNKGKQKTQGKDN